MLCRQATSCSKDGILRWAVFQESMHSLGPSIPNDAWREIGVGGGDAVAGHFSTGLIVGSDDIWVRMH